MDAAGVLIGAAVSAASLVFGLVMGYRMGQGREPVMLPTVKSETAPEPFEEEARWALRGHTDEDSAP